MIRHKDDELMKISSVKEYFDEINEVMSPLISKLQGNKEYLNMLISGRINTTELQELIKEIVNNDK
tara:strand:+ start:203 stop:400 length:198 start_codon:yes stop_codon:yes gene_type:complete